MTSSADGTKLVAAVSAEYGSGSPGLIYTSTNSGATWEATSAPATNWASIASSAEGTKLMAAAFNFPEDPLHLSTNSGTTWDTVTLDAQTTPRGNWASVACSADAATMGAGAAFIGGYAYGSQMFITTNSGSNWTRQDFSGYPISVACSAEGRIMLAGFDGAIGLFLRTSTNFGTTWRDGPLGEWNAVSCSGDGTTMLAGDFRGGAGGIHMSRDSGDTWTLAPYPVKGSAFALCADGTKMVAVANTGPIFSSTNSGTTWTQNNAPMTNWSSVASSADGCKWVATIQGGGIYTWRTTPKPLLNISPSGSDLLLSWTVPSMNFLLQRTCDLAAANWTNVTAARTLNYAGLRYEVSLTPDARQTFYRLASE